MARTLAEIPDPELEAQFLEAEHNALAWTELGVAGSAQRGSRWMEIAGELRAELERRSASATPKPKKPKTPRPKPKPKK